MSALSKPTAFWERTPILRLLVPFVTGILIYDNTQLNSFSPVTIMLSLVFVCLTCLIMGMISIKNVQFKLAGTLAMMLLFGIIGYGICYIQDEKHEPLWFGNIKTEYKATSAVITSEAQEKNKTVKYEVRIFNTITESSILPCNAHAYLYLYKKEGAIKPNKGDTLLLTGKWSSINNSGNPYEIDYKKNCQRKNFHFHQFLAPEQVRMYGIKDKSKTSFWEQAHQYCIKSINDHIKDSTANALLKAMLVGEENDIDPAIREAYSDTGIIHIISISGAHVAILFAVFGFLLSVIKPRKYDWLKTLLSLLAIWMYILLAGASTPALRAAIMFSILAIGSISHQRPNPLNQLFTTAFLLLLVQPMWLFTIGFQLSFTAVLSLIIFYPPLISIVKSKNKIGQFFMNAIAASIAAEILIAPLVAYYFHSFPAMFLLANIVASMTMGAVLILGMLLIIFGPIKIIASILTFLITSISVFFHYCIEVLQSVNFTPFKTLYLSAGNLLLLYAFIVSLSVVILLKNKKAVWASLGCLLLLSLTHLHRSWQISTSEQLIVFNQSKESHCEIIRANTYTVLSGSDEETWANRNTRIGLGSLHKTNKRPGKIFLIGEKKVLLLDSNTIISNPFPADIIVVQSWKKYIQIDGLKKAFSPKQIVIANNQNKYQEKEWKEQCAASNIALHNTKTDGAFILPQRFK